MAIKVKKLHLLVAAIVMAVLLIPAWLFADGQKGISNVTAKRTINVEVKGTANTTGRQVADNIQDHNWLQKLKNPTDWFSWGGDLRLREVYSENTTTLRDDIPGRIEHFQRYRSRIKAIFKLNDDITINTRLVWEFRNWCKPHDGNHPKDSNIDWDEALFDKLNIEFKHFLNMPLTLKIGRQDITFGDKWLVRDGTPGDGTRTNFFDAVRGTFAVDKYNTFDAVYIDQHAEADDTIKPFNNRNRIKGLTDQNERGAIFNWANTSVIPKGKLEGFFIWKHDMPIPVSTTNDGDIFAFGARGAGAINDNWKYRAEFAQELGHKLNYLGQYARLNAFGFNSRISYMFNDAHKNELHIGYEYLSGDDPSTSTNEQFDLLWGRWTRWTKSYTSTYSKETRSKEIANLYRLTGGWAAKLSKNIKLYLDYHLLFAAENTRKDKPTSISFSQHGKFRGQLITAQLKYKYTKHISGHLRGEALFPGNYYSHSNRDPIFYLRYELMLTF